MLFICCINHHPAADKNVLGVVHFICWTAVYPVEKVIQALSNQGLVGILEQPVQGHSPTGQATRESWIHVREMD